MTPKVTPTGRIANAEPNLQNVPVRTEEGRQIREAFTSKAVKPPEDLYDADPNCDHNVVSRWSGVKCSKCPGWFCY